MWQYEKECAIKKEFLEIKNVIAEIKIQYKFNVLLEGKI